MCVCVCVCSDEIEEEIEADGEYDDEEFEPSDDGQIITRDDQPTGG